MFTGGVVDHGQEDELGWFAAIVECGPVSAASGDAGDGWWVGAPQVAWNDAVWHLVGGGASGDRAERNPEE